MPQFELPGTEDCFNLTGEILIQHHAKIHRADETPELFVDRAAVKAGQRIIAREMSFEC